MPSFFTIPNELLDEILSYLEPVTISYLLRTNRSLASRVAPTMHLHAVAPKDNMAALHWAAMRGHQPLVQYLLTIFPVDLLNSRRETPLTAVCRGQLRNTAAAECTIRMLLEHGADVHGDGSYIPLRKAILWGSAPATRLLLEAGANPNAETEDGEPLVFSAARECGSSTILQTLLDHGADVNATNKMGKTAIMVAAVSGFLAKVSILVASGADLNLVDKARYTVFAYACLCRNEHVVDYLVHCEGLRIKGPDLADRGPVYLTIVKGYSAALRILLERGASTDYIDAQGRTIMHIAIASGRNLIIRALLDHGVSVDTVDNNGLTPLMTAINLEDRSIMTMLLSHQPDRTRDGFAPLLLACTRGAHTMVELLLDKGTDINRVDERGMTAMAQAKLEGLDHVVEILEQYGGNLGVV